MKYPLSLTLILVVIFLAACQTADEAEPTIQPSSETDAFPRPTVTPIPDPENESQGVLPEGYPPPPSPVPSPEGYPAPPTPQPTLDPYPVGGYLWIIRAVGEQCTEADDNDYADLQEAVAALAAAGVPVRGSGITELIVCAACGCPTSAHFTVEIESSSLSRAESLGWTEKED